MPSAVCWSKMVLRLSVSFSLARVMWRSNLSSGTSFLCLDAMIAFRWFIKKILCFTSLRSAGLNWANLYVGMLHSALLGYNFAKLRSTVLRYTVLRCATLSFAVLGYNFAMPCSSQLNYTQLCSTLFGCNCALLNYLSHCSACLYYTLLRCVRM